MPSNSTELWCDVVLMIRIRAGRKENPKPYEVVSTLRRGMSMNHAIPQLTLSKSQHNKPCA